MRRNYHFGVRRLVGALAKAVTSPRTPKLLLLLSLLVFFAACKREQRQFEPTTPAHQFETTQSELRPGAQAALATTKNDSENRAYDVSEGKRLFTAYNCAGCHANGGGSIGPPLMDEKWIYGSDSVNIVSTIIEGRPNGMPSFRQKIPDNQVQQLVAYVRSMSGQLRKDVAPTRNDDMNARRSEQRTERKTPQQTTAPPQ